MQNQTARQGHAPLDLNTLRFGHVRAGQLARTAYSFREQRIQILQCLDQ